MRTGSRRCGSARRSTSCRSCLRYADLLSPSIGEVMFDAGAGLLSLVLLTAAAKGYAREDSTWPGGSPSRPRASAASFRLSAERPCSLAVDLGGGGACRRLVDDAETPLGRGCSRPGRARYPCDGRCSRGPGLCHRRRGHGRVSRISPHVAWDERSGARSLRCRGRGIRRDTRNACSSEQPAATIPIALRSLDLWRTCRNKPATTWNTKCEVAFVWRTRDTICGRSKGT